MSSPPFAARHAARHPDGQAPDASSDAAADARVVPPRRYLNNTGVPLSIAVFLATDTYDYSNDPDTVSVTALLRPLRQLILADRVAPADALLDVAGFVQNRIGNAIHEGVERAWVHHHESALASLGIPPGQIQRIRVNPDLDDPAIVQRIADGDILAVHTERRHRRKIVIQGPRGPVTMTLSGKSDLVCDGQLEDIKTTTTFTYTHGTKTEDQGWQGSLYRWLSPEVITSDFMRVLYLFMDWKAFKVKAEKGYPTSRILGVKVPLHSLADTERFIREKLTRYLALRQAPQEELPWCNDEQLWRGAPVYRYYRNPDKACEPGARSTKNFDSASEAYARQSADGCVGAVVERPGLVKACHYCPAASICDQRASLAAAGQLADM